MAGRAPELLFILLLLPLLLAAEQPLCAGGASDGGFPGPRPPWINHYEFIVEETPYTRLCRTKPILTVNGKFPGPTLHVTRGETWTVDVVNRSPRNITIHWHGVKQPRNPWSDGPAYITQCPIRPGGRFTYTVIFSTEEGTVWWHAHNDFDRATVHGAIVVHPPSGGGYPFPVKAAEHVIIFSEWWIEEVDEVLRRALATGGDFNQSDAFTINGQPGDLYPCSSHDTFKLRVKSGETYLLRVVNAAMSSGLFFAVADHMLTIVGSDGSYLAPTTRDYMIIYPGETMDILLTADQPNDRRYYLAAHAFEMLPDFDRTITTAIVDYVDGNPERPAEPLLPALPNYNDSVAAANTTFSLRGLLANGEPSSVPKTIDERILMTVSVNLQPCEQPVCQGPNGTRFASSLNNLSFVDPPIDILEAYYYRIPSIFGTGFPTSPPRPFNYTAAVQPAWVLPAQPATETRVIEYGTAVEVVYQGTTVTRPVSHPMHLHGYSFYVVGWGYGNFDAERDPATYNLIDPPFKNTIGLPVAGWVAVRFVARNPGVWFLHCHIERHLIWGMNTVFIVKDGLEPMEKMLPPPPFMPPCGRFLKHDD